MVIFDSARLYSLAPAAETAAGPRSGWSGTVDERGQSGLLVALEDPEVDHADAQDHRDHGQHRQMATGGAADEQHGHQHRGQHQGRPEIGLLVDQGERDGGQDQYDQQSPERRSRPLAAAQ